MKHDPAIVLFDAVGTLIYAEPAVAEVYAAVGRRFGSRLSLAEIAGRFRSAFAAEEQFDAAAGHRTDEERELRRWRSIVGRVLDDLTEADCEPAFRALWDHFARPDAWRHFDDARPVIERLAARGVTLGVASNFDRRLPSIIAELLPQIPADRVFVSSLVGFRKPTAAFFEQCRERLGGGPMLMVGDDVENDFYGARKAGLQSVLVDRETRHPELSPRIVDLREIV